LSYVELDHLTKRYGPTLAVDNAHVAIERGEFFSLLGPSGCGKSTTLRMIAGFIAPTSGSIRIGGEDMTRLPPERRQIGIVFQNYAIFPHMNVFDNIAFGLRMRKVAKDEIARRVRAALAQVGLSGYEARYQRELSGGEQQRVALARVLITEPRILLLDEPLSALDKKLREEMKYWIKDLQVSLGITTIYVTHDQGEALTMSDRIAVMNRGRIAQIGAPEDIYERPADRFVTGFIGESNILEAKVREVAGDELVLALGEATVRAPRRDGLAPGEAVMLVLRPEHVVIGSDAATAGYNRLKARVEDEVYQGAFIRYRLGIGGLRIVAEIQNRPERPIYPPGSEIEIGWHPASTGVLRD